MQEHDITFVCLPANSTDKMQPLDVGIFRPMKNAWRAQLRRYQEQDPNFKILQKTEFPGMLKELVMSLDTQGILHQAFKKCSLFPIDREQVLERIPAAVQTEEIAQHVDAALLKKLEVRRFGEGKKKQPRGKQSLLASSTVRTPARTVTRSARWM